jgi:hypothetical protein
MLADVELADGVVTGSFEQSVFHHGVERPQLPAVEEVGSTRWYQQLKVPVVACGFTVREVTALDLASKYEDDLVFGVDWVEAGRRLVFDGADVAVLCARPNLEITATDRVVRHERVRRWRIGTVESRGPWTDD